MAERLDKRMRSKISPCISSCRVVQGGHTRGNFENQECRRCHLRSFCNAIKISDLPELCLFADVSEEKVPIYSMLLNVFEVGHASSVGWAYRLVDGRGFGPHARHILSWRFGHEKKNTIFSPFKKDSCQLLAKEYVLSTCKLPRRLAQEVWIG